jgi:hypothetical protein
MKGRSTTGRLLGRVAVFAALLLGLSGCYYYAPPPPAYGYGYGYRPAYYPGYCCYAPPIVGGLYFGGGGRWR